MISKELTDEINLLLQFDLDSAQVGLKIHSNADKSVVEAGKRLQEKGHTDREDGGYLTALGRETAEHLQRAYRILESSSLTAQID